MKRMKLFMTSVSLGLLVFLTGCGDEGCLSWTSWQMQKILENTVELAPRANQKGVEFYNRESWNKELDYRLSVMWFERSAQYGYADAQNNLGLCYERGHGVKQSYAEAVKWYRKAAEQGCADAMARLAECYEKGLGVPQSAEEAEKWSRRYRETKEK